MQSETIVSAARVLLPRGVWLAPGAVLVRAGRIDDVGAPGALHARSPRAERVELAGCALLPGLVDAHAHLELSALPATLPRGGDFLAWVREIVRARAQQSPAQLERAALRGARLALEGGATTVGDFDSTGAAERALRESPSAALPRVVLFRELLDAGDPARTASESARIEAAFDASPRLRLGLAPHAPHTASPALLRAAGAAARLRGLPLAIHWAETQEEDDWLEHGRGPFAQLLGESPRRSGLRLLEESGLLGGALALVHGNRARPEELARVARSGATLVHCPGTHAWFERAPFDLRAWRAAGVPVALGTDSLASNTALDMRLELARLAASQPGLDARDAWDAATVHGARALGLAGEIGQLRAGFSADLLAVAAPEEDGERCFERIAHGDFDIRHAWVAGLAVPAAGACAERGNSPASCAPGEGNPG